MGKRSNFERKERDFYPTPYEAVIPLFPHLEKQTRFWEPCAGDGALVEHLTGKEHIPASVADISPRSYFMQEKDVFSVTQKDVRSSIAEVFITNPPWDRKILHPLIEHLSDLLPTWLLFDADWAHTKQAAPYLKRCAKIVSVGRVQWIPDSKHTGKDNCAWYLFKSGRAQTTKFYGQRKSGA